jgi:predicted ATPase
VSRRIPVLGEGIARDWLDAATIHMIEDLLTQPDVRYLLVNGAYRNNEVSVIHRLRRTLDTICHAGATIQEISLVPLACHDVGQLMADALRCEPACVVSLA